MGLRTTLSVDQESRTFSTLCSTLIKAAINLSRSFYLIARTYQKVRSKIVWPVALTVSLHQFVQSTRMLLARITVHIYPGSRKRALRKQQPKRKSPWVKSGTPWVSNRAISGDVLICRFGPNTPLTVLRVQLHFLRLEAWAHLFLGSVAQLVLQNLTACILGNFTNKFDPTVKPLVRS